MKTNQAPRWAKGTLIWRMSLADRPAALEKAEETIKAVYGMTDGAVRQIVFLNGVVGVDEGRLAWDGSWPYWGRTHGHCMCSQIRYAGGLGSSQSRSCLRMA